MSKNNGSQYTWKVLSNVVDNVFNFQNNQLSACSFTQSPVQNLVNRVASF